MVGDFAGAAAAASEAREIADAATSAIHFIRVPPERLGGVKAVAAET
jgi:hypothetical protein